MIARVLWVSLALVGSCLLASDADAIDRRVKVSGVVIDVDHAAREMTVAVQRGRDVIRLKVLVPPDTVIIDVDRDGRTRIRFSDISPRDNVSVDGQIRHRRGDLALIAHRIVRRS